MKRFSPEQLAELAALDDATPDEPMTALDRACLMFWLGCLVGGWGIVLYQVFAR